MRDDVVKLWSSESVYRVWMGCGISHNPRWVVTSFQAFARSPVAIMSEVGEGASLADSTKLKSPAMMQWMLGLRLRRCWSCLILSAWGCLR
jgi:hypothetical protein